MSQEFVKNDRYLVKTPHGWESFEGVIKTTGDIPTLKLTLSNQQSIQMTPDHRLMKGSNTVVAQHLQVGDTVETTQGNLEIIQIGSTYNNEVYDIFNSESHTVIANDISSHQCDELAFAKKKVAREMWSAVFPTLSCLAPDTYVLGDHGYVKIKHYFSGSEQAGEYFVIHNESMYTHRQKMEPLSHGYVSPGSDTLIIHTQTGYKVEVTYEHPLLTDKGMIKAESLNIGDLLRCDLNMNVFGQTKYLSGSSVPYDTTGYPEYVMMYRRESVIDFLSDELFEERPLECLYQQKLLLANLGIGSSIINNKIHILKSYEIEYIDVFGHAVDAIDEEIVDHDTFFFDKIKMIETSHQSVTYDFTVPEARSFLQNGIMGSNTGGRCIVTSTPSDDETLFAELWRNANRTIDEHGNDMDVGINGFKSLKVTWDQHPERDESYKKLQIAQFGEEKFRREHELEFISMEETLIDPVLLSKYEGSDPLSKTGDIRWYAPIDKTKMYVIGYDPSLGTGRDNSAIVIYEFPTLLQVGEWIHNKSDVPTQIKILKRILDMFKDAGFDEESVFWSLENNSIGEAPLVMIKHELGEEEFFGTFMKERKRRSGSRIRGGFFTDHTEKMKACNRFKIWFEQGKLLVKSKPMIAELKGFVAQGRTYKARQGDTDDIVMATLLVVRMVEIIMQEEEEYLEELGVTANNLFDDDDDDDEGGWGDPMPML